MATRDEEAAQWRAISRNSRKAAQHLLEVRCYRSSVSRSYYAAYAALTVALIQQGITLGHGGNNPGHAGLPVYVLNNLTFLPQTARFELNKALRRLYAARIEADYHSVSDTGEKAVLGLLRARKRARRCSPALIPPDAPKTPRKRPRQAAEVSFLWDAALSFGWACPHSRHGQFTGCPRRLLSLPPARSAPACRQCA